MNIGQAAKASGISAKMIRYYEAIDLVPKADRTDGGYRDYSPNDVHRLLFIRRARELGFSFDQVRQLLRLWGDKKRSSAKVKQVALEHIAKLELRATHLQQLIGTLKHLANACGGNHRPDCPIIDELEFGHACCDEAPVKARAAAKGRRARTSTH
jgi:Cu(I)-responsive transcriptional regulator